MLDCQNYINFPAITVSLQLRKCNFIQKLAASENGSCQSSCSFAQRELDNLAYI